MVYAIWDTDSANRLGEYSTEAKALADVRATVKRFGRDEVLSWALARHEGDEVEAVAEGEALIDLAFSVRA